MPNGDLINEMLVSAKGPTEKAMAEYARRAWELKAHIQKEIKEEEMDDTLALNGSMPAYAYLFAKAFIDYANKKGIDYDVARDLTCAAIKGSMDMILANKETPIDTLIDNVCSKGGTTIAGLNKLYDNEFEKAIYECSEACSNRSKELGK